MSVKPAEYLDRYLNLRVPLPTGVSLIRINRYRNNDIPDTLGNQYRVLKDSMIGFYQRHNPPGSGVVVNGQRDLSAASWTPPIINYLLANFMHAFTGKIAPEDLATFLRLFSYWREHPHDFPSAFASSSSNLQTFANNYLGLDCSGFVGAYFRSQYPGSGVEPNTSIRHYREHWPERTEVREIQEHDVLIWPGFAHIAVINTINQRTTDQVTCSISQSAADGAVQGIVTLGPYTITFNHHELNFRLAGPQNITLEALVRVPR